MNSTHPFYPILIPNTPYVKFFSKKFDGSIYLYRVFYIPIFRRIEGGWNPPTPRSLRYRKSVVLRGLKDNFPCASIYCVFTTHRLISRPDYLRALGANFPETKNNCISYLYLEWSECPCGCYRGISSWMPRVPITQSPVTN